MSGVGFKKSDEEIAENIFQQIKHDMKHRKLYRHGIDVNVIYEWYSSDSKYRKQEFISKVLPLVERLLKDSPTFIKEFNRYGRPVWKLSHNL